MCACFLGNAFERKGEAHYEQKKAMLFTYLSTDSVDYFVSLEIDDFIRQQRTP